MAGDESVFWAGARDQMQKSAVLLPHSMASRRAATFARKTVAKSGPSVKSMAKSELRDWLAKKPKSGILKKLKWAVWG